MYRALDPNFTREVNLWMNRELSLIPTGLAAQAHRAAEEGLVMSDGSSCDEVLELIGSPERECPRCGHKVELSEFKFNLGELEGTEESDTEAFDDDNRERVCPECDEVVTEGELGLAYPNYAYPCAHGWMAQPSSDGWFREHAAEIAELGFYVYDGAYGVLLGIDDGHLIARAVETGLGWKLLGSLRVKGYDRRNDEITFEGTDGGAYALPTHELKGWVPVTDAEFAEDGFDLGYQTGDSLYRFPNNSEFQVLYVVEVDKEAPRRISVCETQGTFESLKAAGVDWVVSTRDHLIEEGWYADPRSRSV